MMMAFGGIRGVGVEEHAFGDGYVRLSTLSGKTVERDALNQDRFGPDKTYAVNGVLLEKHGLRTCVSRWQKLRLQRQCARSVGMNRWKSSQSSRRNS